MSKSKKQFFIIRAASGTTGASENNFLSVSVLPFALAVMALVVTGCPHNEYIVQLTPRGNLLDRTLVFYRADGVNTNTATPNYASFDKDEMAAITALYPAQSLINDGDRHEVRGEFKNKLPSDVGGAGTYSHLATSLGEVGFYEERFRGNDDLVGMSEQRSKAADRLGDLILGWSQMELGRKPGYDKLRRFLNVDFRRDLKNFSTYWWAGQLAGDYKTNASEECNVRFGQYLQERGYFTAGELPEILGSAISDDPKMLLTWSRRLLARKMGVPDAEPVPAFPSFLADESTMNESFDKYLASTEFYRLKLKQWKKDKKLKPDLKQPEPSEVATDALGHLLEFDLGFSHADYLTVRLSLPSTPTHSNGRWNAALKQLVWETGIVERTNATHLPFTCYASWAKPDETFQAEHIGKVALIGDELMRYCLWRNGLDAERGSEWDAFLASLQPVTGLMEKIDAFQFSGKPNQAGTNSPQKIFNPSTHPRELFKAALSK